MAERVDIDVARNGDSVRVTVRDNGRGFAQHEGKPTRFGLIGMRERIQALAGEFHMDSALGRGTTVTAALPVARRTQDSNGAEAA
jgi:signal transduction histidine kinase